MTHQRIILVALIILAVALVGCSDNESPTSLEGSGGNEGSEGSGGNEGTEGTEGTEGNGGSEGSEGSEGGSGPGEESATQYTLYETCNMVRLGAQLIIAYDSSSNSFIGTVTNTTTQVLSQVRVEIHLSSGVELGPSPAADLAPGAVRSIILPVSGGSFATYGAHPEIGGSGGDGGGS